MSAPSKTTVCNMALSHLGIGTQVGNIVTEQSIEAKACREFVDIALTSTLKDYKWPWAVKVAALGLEEEDPDNGWGYSYRYPSDCIDIRKVEASFDIAQSLRSQKPSNYELGFDSSGKLIFSDIEDAVIEYTPIVENYNIFPVNFLLALSYRLANYIAPRLTKGDPFKLGIRALQMYQIEIGKASSTSFNEPKPAQAPDSDMITVRNT